MVTSADVAVVGAGVMGASIALELSRSGVRVVVVDKFGGPALGSTSASSAIVRFNYSTWDGVATSWESKHCWERWGDHLGRADKSGLADIRRTGLVMLDVEVAPRAPTVALFDRAGVPYEEWDADTLSRRLPWLDPGRYWPPRAIDDDAFWAPASGRLGALFMPDAGYVDDPQLAGANLADAARLAGATFMFRRQVTEVRTTGGRVAGLTFADGDGVDAPVVVNAAGPWSTALNRIAGIGADFTVAVRPMRQEVHQVSAPPGYGTADAPGPAVADLDLGIYFRPAPGGVLLVGGTEPACDPLQWVDDVDAVSPYPTERIFSAQLTRAARRLPGLSVPPAPLGIAGVYDVSDDWTPVYDRTELDGYYVAMGTSGNQFKNAPLVGKFIRDIVTAVENGHDHDADPVHHRCEITGHVVDLGAFSRRRTRTATTNTVIG